MTVFFSQLINGLSLGSIYALIALGYSMVYGIILLLNFAHGDVIMVGAYMSWFVMNQLGLGPVTAVCATIITCTLLGVVIEKIAYTPLRNAPRISLLITAIGVSFFLEYTAELIMGSGAKVIPAYYTNQTFRLGKVPLGLTSIITLAVTVLSMLVLTFLVQKTKLGKAMRAVSEDMDAARLMGINVNSTISFTFAVGSALAGIGSVLYCCSYPQATPTMGSMLGLKAFVAAVLGGIGSIPGAMIGGVLLAHTASFEAVQAVEGMFNPDYQPRQVGFFPSCTYCYPQVASVGKTERALKEAGVEYKVGKFPFQAIGKAVAAGEPDGFVKTLYGAKNGELLGAHIVGPEATELIAALGIGIQAELTDEDIHATIFAHPTLSEAIHESMLASEGIAIHM